MMIWLPILSLDQIIMHSNVPILSIGTVGIGLKITITGILVIIVMNSGDDVSTYEINKQWLSPETLVTYSDMNKKVKTVREVHKI